VALRKASSGHAEGLDWLSRYIETAETARHEVFKSLPDQLSAVAQLLAGAGAPPSSRDVARAFAAKRQATVTPVLDALAAIGQARRLADGRYAA